MASKGRARLFQDNVSRGFSHGNYANAYETQSLSRMLRGIATRSKAYQDAAVLGFFGSYELDEIPMSARERYMEAYFSDAGKAVLRAGYMDPRDEIAWQEMFDEGRW